jgi:cysteinyl-tRNA synthetase
MLLYNSLSRRKETFEPLDPDRVTLYTCGPTVYRDVHIGNLRTYLLADWLRRVLGYLGYRVFQVKNITDVGHMRQELLDRGEDKVIAAARAAGKSSREIARQYTRAFREDEERLNILPAEVFPRATDHIPQCISLIERMLEKGVAYPAGGNVYFDVTGFPEYGKLSGNVPSSLLQGVRAEVDPHKRHPEDFALWKAAEPGREMKWPSPWGDGFPGWHIECSAMSLHYLGKRFDIHTGGVDNIFPHHEDEIAQSESVTGQPVVRFWVHGQHLLADGMKMAKSSGNDYTVRDLEERGFDPLAFRYLCLTLHYRNRLNFTFNGLKGAQRGLSRLRRQVEEPVWRDAAPPQGPAAEGWKARFREAICEDLAIPRALDLTWRMVRDPALSARERASLLVEFDQVLGLGLGMWPERARAIPPEIEAEALWRQDLRRLKRFREADAARDGMEARGFEVRDTGSGSRVLRRSPVEWRGIRKEISSPKEVPSLLEEPDQYDFTVSLVAHNNWEELQRCYRSVRENTGRHRIQVAMVEGGSTDGTRKGVARLVEGDPDAALWFADHPLGEGAFRNVTLRQALGRIVVILDVSVELTGDIFSPLARTLAPPEVGAAGPRGLVTEECQTFLDAPGPDAHAMTLYCFAFRREVIRQAGWMDERFRFYRHLDLDYSFRIRSEGYGVRVVPDLALRFHPHRVWEEMEEHERMRRSRANFYLFYRRWHHREELFSPLFGAGVSGGEA